MPYAPLAAPVTLVPLPHARGHALTSRAPFAPSEQVPYSRLFVIAEHGPTSFVLRGEHSARKFKV